VLVVDVGCRGHQVSGTGVGERLVLALIAIYRPVRPDRGLVGRTARLLSAAERTRDALFGDCGASGAGDAS
jgi:hypothetical protein